MNVIAKRIQMLAASDWWNSLTKIEKRDYVVKHPNSKYAKEGSGPRIKAHNAVKSMKNAKRSEKKLARVNKRMGQLKEMLALTNKHLKSATGTDKKRLTQRSAKITKYLEFLKTRHKFHSDNLKKHSKTFDTLHKSLPPAIRKHITKDKVNTQGLKGVFTKGRPKSDKPAAKKPAAKKPESKVSDKTKIKNLLKDDKPAAKKPAAEKPATKKQVEKPAVKKPAPKKEAAPKTTKMEGKKGSLHEHLKIPHGEKLPVSALVKLANSDHPLAGRAAQRLRFGGYKGPLGPKKDTKPEAEKPAVKKPAAKKPAAEKPASKKADVEDTLDVEKKPRAKNPAAKNSRIETDW